MTRDKGVIHVAWLLLTVSVTCTLGSRQVADDVTMSSLSMQFKTLEELVLKQQMLLGRQEKQLQDLSATVSLQQDKLEEQAVTIEELQQWKRKHSLEDTRVNSPPGKDKVKEERIMTEKLGSLSLPMGNGTVRTERFVTGVEGPIAFHATMRKGVELHIGPNQNIIFETTRLNLGGGYHVNHGLFVAPAPGIYIFSLSVMSHSTAHKDVFVAMVKNGHILATAYANGTPDKPFDQGSVSVVVQLATGDEVWVKDDGRPDMTIFGDDDTSFMGCLVIPL